MLILDANILMAAVLGKRTRSLLTQYGVEVEFASPDFAFQETEKRLPEVIERRNLPKDALMTYFGALTGVVGIIDSRTYLPFKNSARRRLFRRDENDWPILGSALALECPIWTEDLDFFGCGVATWTSDRVESFLEAAIQ